MTDNILVSVAIITHNQTNLFKECIESVLIQDHSNIEIIVTDDCSTDGTQEIIKEYEKEYPSKIKGILSASNLSITVNFNAGQSNCMLNI